MRYLFRRTRIQVGTLWITDKWQQMFVIFFYKIIARRSAYDLSFAFQIMMGNDGKKIRPSGKYKEKTPGYFEIIKALPGYDFSAHIFCPAEQRDQPGTTEDHCFRN
jgi:hypothetical protein